MSLYFFSFTRFFLKQCLNMQPWQASGSLSLPSKYWAWKYSHCSWPFIYLYFKLANISHEIAVLFYTIKDIKSIRYKEREGGGKVSIVKEKASEALSTTQWTSVQNLYTHLSCIDCSGYYISQGSLESQNLLNVSIYQGKLLEGLTVCSTTNLTMGSYEWEVQESSSCLVS